ncbi:MAG: hypothetical protein ACYTGC_10285, partial [Planctomycetota bacterium]
AMCSGTVLLLLGAIEGLALLGRRDEVAELYPAIREFVSLDSGVQSFTYGLHERFAGIAAAAAGAWEAADTHFGKALELAERLPHRVDQARVRYWYARTLIDRDGPDDRDRAEQMLHDARAMSESIGMVGHIDLIDALLEDARQRRGSA